MSKQGNKLRKELNISKNKIDKISKFSNLGQGINLI